VAAARGETPRRAEAVLEPIRLTADGGYDTREVYTAVGSRGARVVVPPRRDAVVTGDPVFADRDAHIERIAGVGRRRWRVEVGQHSQARVENTFFRHKRLFGGRSEPAASRRR